ncbi:MAG TPA: DHA2 family efflux MFS transporter permease subunit [Haliangiales bacterium]|nr:DHA2 family efflux MFS transporter permease subunit [Haliangiales bacterium]
MTTAVATFGSEARVNKWFVATAVALGALLEIIDTSIVNVALADMQAELGATLNQVSWVVSSYAVANVIILPLSAWLGMRFGKKKYFLFSLVGFTAASVLCGLATTLPMLIAARVLQGLMGGGLLAKAQAILFETFPREEQAAAQGFFGAIVIAGPVIGPTLGGYIVTNIGWRWIFFINVPVGIVAVILTIMALPQDAPSRDRSRVDWLAILLLAVGLGALQTMLEEGNADDWFQSQFIVAMGVAAVAGLAAFIWRELRSDRPVVDLKVLRYRSLWAGSLLSLVVGMALYGALFAIPIFAQSILGMSSQQTGLLLLPGALVSAACMPLAANLTRRFDPRLLLAVGGVVLVVALVMLARLSPQTGEVDLFWPLIVRAFGTVFMFLPLSLATIAPIPKQDMAAATGFYNLTRQLGGSIGVAVLATLLSDRTAFHRAVLAEKLVPSDPHVIERISSMTAAFAARGMSPQAAHQMALGLLDRTVQAQSAVMSFGDTFLATAALVLCFLPLVLVLGRAAKGAAVAGGH